MGRPYYEPLPEEPARPASEPQASVPCADRFKPGKLNNLQRDYIIAASRFFKGEPVPFSSTHVPYQGRHSLNGLVTRGLLEERSRGFFYLTENGWKVARAIHALMNRKHEVREIEAHLDTLAKARGVQP